MYRHLLVPIDASDLSTSTVGKAVEFARCLGARITFFHAQIDYAAAFLADATAVRVTQATSPDDLACSFQGPARELLTKAESAARAQGVVGAVATAACDSPWHAIIAAARLARCDLIFMASHGGTGMESQTLQVLMNAEIPVLVSATHNPPAPPLALAILRAEHRALAAVLQAWLRLCKTASAAGAAPLDHALLHAMIRYLKVFPLEQHHPKESEYLFARLRARTSEFNAELDELERQHQRDHELVAALEIAVEKYCGGEIAADELDAAVNHYAKFMWEHMGREEGVIIPAAQRELTAADWAELDAAFAAHRPDGGATAAEFHPLFARIAALAPAAEKTT